MTDDGLAGADSVREAEDRRISFMLLLTERLHGDVDFAMLNPRDYTEYVMLSMDKDCYEPETRATSLAAGFMGTWSNAQKGLVRAIFVQKDIARGLVLTGKKEDLAEHMAPRDFAPVCSHQRPECICTCHHTGMVIHYKAGSCCSECPDCGFRTPTQVAK